MEDTRKSLKRKDSFTHILVNFISIVKFLV